MNVQNVNSLNFRLNMISGNLLPMTNDDSSYSTFWKIYSFLVWLEVVQICMIIPGSIYVPKEKFLRDGLIGIVGTLEVVFLVVQIHARKKLVQKLIKKLNDILRVDDEIMRSIVINTIKPIEVPIKFYWTSVMMCTTVWVCAPFMLIFQRNIFFYVDYRMPLVISKEPFSTSIFVLGTFIALISILFIFTKKVSVDTYMINLVLLLTAQYKYIALKLSMIFHGEIPQINDNNSTKKKIYFDTNFNEEMQMKYLCRHHNAVIRVTLMLRKLLSLNFSLIYIINVFRFCGVAILIISIPLMTAFEGFLVVIFSFGGILHFYTICSCVQQLLDASIDLTDQAFHQEWYRFKSAMKRTFMLMILANNIQIKLSTFERYNLSLPSFMVVLNQSYSIALLLLKTN